NGEPVREHVTKDSPGERAINRDLSLTWSAELAEDNELVAGQWWHQLPQTEGHHVSVESELAQSLGIGLGDQLGFIVGGTRIEAGVSSIRRVNWDNFTPNFYMVLSPGALEGMPTTLLTSFHLPVEQREGLREPPWTGRAISCSRSPWPCGTCWYSCCWRAFPCCLPPCNRHWTPACTKAPCCAPSAPAVTSCARPTASNSACSARWPARWP